MMGGFDRHRSPAGLPVWNPATAPTAEGFELVAHDVHGFGFSGYAGHHLNSKFDATGDLGHIEALLAALPRTLDTQDAFYWIADNLRMVEEMERAETALCRCSALSVQLCTTLDQLPSFFSPRLFSALDAWGQDPSPGHPTMATGNCDGRCVSEVRR